MRVYTFSFLTWKIDLKRSAIARLSACSYKSFMVLNNLFTYGQSNARAGIVYVAVQALE